MMKMYCWFTFKYSPITLLQGVFFVIYDNNTEQENNSETFAETLVLFGSAQEYKYSICVARIRKSLLMVPVNAVSGCVLTHENTPEAGHGSSWPVPFYVCLFCSHVLITALRLLQKPKIGRALYLSSLGL